MGKTIQQVVTVSATPHEVYETLMDSGRHAALIGAEATISREVGGPFAVFGGDISGETVELVPDHKIVQRWRAGNWPQGHYSTATFLLEAADGGTRLTLKQTDVPDDQVDSIAEGWREYYWDKLEALFSA